MKKFIVSVLALFLLAGNVMPLPSYKNVTLLTEARRAVTDKDVIDYLTIRGYRNVTIIEVMSNGDRVCTSDCPCITTVFVDGDYIVGHEDAPIGKP